MYTAHFLMREKDLIEYVKTSTDLFEDDEDLLWKDIGDGNVNYVSKVWSPASGRSVVVKQADTATRLSKRALDLDRNRIEAELLVYENKLAPGLVPEVYLYDPVMAAVIMEDLSGLQIMRYALMEEETFPLFSDHITDFMAKTLANTTDFVLPSAEKKALVGRFINPAMCDISERLVYTDPYFTPATNTSISPENLSFVNDEYQKDEQLLDEVAALKLDFMTNAQALIHGDLHTGSIFVDQVHTKIIDPEFAFFGPIGYDVGNVLANLIFAWVRAYVRRDSNPTRNPEFLPWVQLAVEESIDQFIHKFGEIIKVRNTLGSFSIHSFQKKYLQSLVSDSLGVTGLEINRRVIGTAKVVDVTTIKPTGQRALAERILMEAAREFIINRTSFGSGADISETIREIFEKSARWI